MKKISRRSFLAASGLLAASAALTACGGNASSGAASGSASSGTHEPISICVPMRDVGAFIEVVHKYYPEINFEVIPYAGLNGTTYMMDQLLSGEVPDIYSASVYTSAQRQSEMADRLIDLAGYSFTNNYVQARLREVTENGAIYLLPSYFSCLGITYNKKILADNGWELPKSMKEVEELAPKVREAGYDLCLNQLQFPGYGFQFLCNILDTGFLSTMEGREWQNKFLDGEATFAGTPEMVENLQSLQRWRDLGMLNASKGFSTDGEVATEMAKENTLFMLGATNDLENYGGDKSHFGLMPYLSENGDQNVFILNVTRFMGLSKKLEEPLHVMEVMSTVEGMEVLNSNYKNAYLAPLKDAPVVEGSYFEDILDQVNAGYTAPFIYTGWENMIVPDGNAAISFIRGEIGLEELTATLDDSRKLVDDPSSLTITTATETISTEDCAKLVGIVFAKASGADLALISLHTYLPDDRSQGNSDGVSGQIFALPVTSQEIVAILPTGWRNNIETYTLTGKQIKELQETGFDRKGNGICYPYQLVAKDGFTLDDNATYTVVICGATDAVKEEGNVQDTGILGLTAMEDYLSQFETLSAKDIVWE